MTATPRLIPLPDGVTLNGAGPDATVRYKIVNISNANDASAFAIASTPEIITTVYGYLFRNDCRVTRAAYNHWNVEIPYVARWHAVGEWTWDFDTTGGTVHLTQAREEVARYPSSTAPNQYGAIAVDNNEVKGVEIIIPAMKINVQFTHEAEVVTLARAKFLSDITGTVNTDTFLTFEPGQVLFLGARGSDGSEQKATISYQFAMAKNSTGQTIGSISGVAKKAWDVAWIKYQDAVTEEGGKEQPTRVAKFVYVDRVYEEIAMASALGFGGA